MSTVRNGTGRRLPIDDFEQVAGNGMLERRALLRGAGAATATLAAASPALAQPGPLAVEPWMREPGERLSPHGARSRHEAAVMRDVTTLPGAPGTGASRVPLHLMAGTITPNTLHFERHHNGIPQIDPARHRLVIHGLVRRPLVFTAEALDRYPMVSRIAFLECGGNSQLLYAPQAAPFGLQRLHGLVACAEWTGVRLADLLNEAEIDPRARWLIAEGADAASFSRSIPMEKAMDDAIVALYQNGERVHPANGYPMRLLLPGFEGAMNVKWLRRLTAVEQPMMTRDETARYTLLRPDGRAQQFAFVQEAKSIITRPSPEMGLREQGLHEINGLAWSGYGKIARVDVSADGGTSWAPAHLQEPVLSKALTRFRMPWRWQGAPAVLMSRATDETGQVQPTRAELLAERGARAIFHNTMIAAWGVAANGEVGHVYA